MLISEESLMELEPDSQFPNIVPGLKKALLRINEIKGVNIEGQSRRTVTSKIMKRIHSYIHMSKGDYMVDLDDIITYLDNVSFVNITALPIIYKAVTGQPLPPIVMHSHLMKKFVSEGRRSLYQEEKYFFKDNYMANSFFLRSPSFSGSSAVAMADMEMYHSIERWSTPFTDLITYIEAKGDIVALDENYFMSRKAYKAEQYVSDNIGGKVDAMITNPKEIIIDPKYSEEQRESVTSILTSKDKFVCLTGPAGSGKTAVLSSVVENAFVHKNKILACSFTGKAASRMEQSELNLAHLVIPPKTIHSLMATLKYGDIIDVDVVIIDEASTMNSELFADFIKVLGTNSTLEKIKFVLVGDANQLPPIGGGQIFEDILTLGMYPTYRLTKIFRTTDKDLLALYSDVLKTKHRLGMSKHAKYFKTYNPNDCGDFMRNLVALLFKKDKLWYKDNKCIMLSHTNKYVDYINYLCYKELTGHVIDFYEYTFEDHPEGLEVEWSPIPVFWKGAKIIFTKNNKIDVKANGRVVRVNNGTVGEVVGFFDDLVEIKSYDDGSTFYVEGDYRDIKLSYAMTVFKSQGSEAQFVIYIHSNHIFETKRLAYTAMTRARKNLKIYTPIDGFKMSMDVPRFTNINSK